MTGWPEVHDAGTRHRERGKLIRWAETAMVAAALLVMTSPTAARPSGLKALPAPAEVVLDGVPGEFTGEWRRLDCSLGGPAPAADDLAAKALVAYDERYLYVAADVDDDVLVGGADRVELLLGIPGGTVFSALLYPGVPGKSKAAAKTGAGRAISGARVVEAPKPTPGYTLEAQIPWSAVPRSSTVRVGFRGAILVHDADRSRAVESVVATTTERGYASLPPLSTEPELSLGAGLLRQRNLVMAPSHNLMANLVGDGLEERLLVYGRFFVVLGPGYRGGHEYFFRDLGSDELTGLELKDLTGDGKPEMLVRKRLRGSAGSVETIEVLSYHGGSDVIRVLFAHEIALELAGGSGWIKNELAFARSGSATTIVVRAGSAKGIDPARFRLASATGAAPVLLPWGQVASRTFGFRPGGFEPVGEEPRVVEPDKPPPPVVGPGPDAPGSPKPATPGPSKPATGPAKPPDGPDPDAAYALYRKRAGAEGKARFDLRADLAEDRRPERLLLHGTDLVIVGEGFRGGRSFAALTINGVRDENDIDGVSTRDLTGDGKAEIVVRGRMRAPLPDDLGPGEMIRSVVLVFQVRGGAIERVFAAEVGRQVGDKRITANIAFAAGGSHPIELTPGKAVGYDEQSYPWRQKEAPTDGFEPLLLPWGGIARVRLRYDGTAFVR